MSKLKHKSASKIMDLKMVLKLIIDVKTHFVSLKLMELLNQLYNFDDLWDLESEKNNTDSIYFPKKEAHHLAVIDN